MEKRSMRPWLPYIVAGGIVAGEGGSMLSSGAEFYYLANLVQNISYMGSSAVMYRMMALPFLIIGAISLPIGLILLGVGLNKKQKLKALQQSPQELPFTIKNAGGRSTERINKSDFRFCMQCGNKLLDGASFCGFCGTPV